MNQQYYDITLKILIIGNSNVGKTCMVMRYCENQFTNEFYATIGVDFKTKNLQIDDKIIKLQIWDTAGQDRFRTITNNYYRGANGILIVYDITDRDSFQNVKQWMYEIEKNAKENVQKILVGNKCDQNDQRQVDYEEGLHLSQQYNLTFFEASAKNSHNIELSFQTLVKNIVEKGGFPQKHQGLKIGRNYNQKQVEINRPQTQKNCCC
ncbi:Ras family protein, putative [Ichthyophthirius multifiliis]|uniref:Ras-related protein Rab-1 n=1 Tax=Ichthyophthirius multifiliis TaxID=5932 RepID=G0QZC0_ICHMU|nr:Ras family protein, putative [Ichthyophthirius multifiliis]EGR29423.1 Ras family protein, putative [Ichthyophthirius multifiliis]|eukprot:XP_004030659.1 Ras family protein, putative [Ichthyophthirius multifiliis]